MLGPPWPKHACMATQPDMAWLKRGIRGGVPDGSRVVFGVILEATVIEPGISAVFVIGCSDGTVVNEEFVYSLNPCEAVGGLVVLELIADNKVGARRFKAVEDMLEAHKSKVASDERHKEVVKLRREREDAFFSAASKAKIAFFERYKQADRMRLANQAALLSDKNRRLGNNSKS